MTKEIFSDFLMEISSLMGEDSFTVLMDNARCHNELPFMSNSHEVRMLLKYSPFLNLTELANSCLKAAVKRRLSESNIQRQLADRVEAARQNLTLQQYRTNVLIDVIKNGVDTITPEKCESWYRHMLKYTRQCLNEVDIYW